MGDKDTSTLQSYVDSASSAINSAIGYVTGNPADKQQAQQKQADAQARDELSHATVKGPGFTATASGVAADDPQRREGQWNQTVGSGKEFLGGIVGSESLKQAGIDQNRQGKEQEAKGQLSDLGSGLLDRAKGTVGSAVAGVTGDTKAQQAYQEIHDTGKTKQRGVEAELQKQAEADQKLRGQDGVQQ